MLIVRLKSDDGRDDVRQSSAADISVGRSADNEVRIDQPTVSSQHLRILSGLVVADCGSLNGTFINGERLKGARLIQSGTEIELGGTATRLVIEESGERPQTRGADHTLALDQTLPADAMPTAGGRRPDQTADLASHRSSKSGADAAAGADARAELDEARRESLKARADLERALGELEVVKEQLEGLRGRAGGTTAGIVPDSSEPRSGADSGAELVALREELGAVRDQLDGSQAELEGVRSSLADALRDATTAREELTRSEIELQRVQGDLAQLRQVHEQLEEQHRQLQEERKREPIPDPTAGFGGGAVKPGEPAGGGALFAHLNQQIQRQQQRIAELESFKASAGGATPIANDGRVRELEQELERARAELATARAAGAEADPAAERPSFETQVFENFREENTKLRAENERLARELELDRERLAAAGRGGEAPPATGETVGLPPASAPPPVAAETAALSAAQARIADLERQLATARSPSAPAAGGPPAAFAGDAGDLWQAFATQDVENREPLLHGPPQEFLTLEVLRLVRKIERVGTRVAQDAIGNIPRDTLLPGQADNLRTFVSRVLADASDMDARRSLVDHAQQLTRWLLVSVAAQRKGAERLVNELRERLSEHALTANSPLSARARFVGKETELWRRAVAVLTEMTPAYLEDRLDELARNEAGKLLQEA